MPRNAKTDRNSTRSTRGLKFLLWVLCFSQHHYSCNATPSAWLAREVRPARNLTFNRRLLFVNDASSDVRCARQCKRVAGCLTFTFTRDGGACRGHSAVMTSGDPQVVEAPWTTYHEIRECCCLFHMIYSCLEPPFQ